MAATRPMPFISLSIVESVQTNTDADATATRECQRDEASREKWQNLIEHKLIEWGRDPGQFDDEGVEPPTAQIIRLAIGLAEQFRDSGLMPPDSVVPDASGGIVFERRENDVSELLRVWDDSTVEYQCFCGARLVERRTL